MITIPYYHRFKICFMPFFKLKMIIELVFSFLPHVKGFVDHKAYGKTHEYFPLVTKEKYTRFYLNNMIRGYFNGSFQNLVSFFARDNKLDATDLEKLLKEMKNDEQADPGKDIEPKNKRK